MRTIEILPMKGALVKRIVIVFAISVVLLFVGGVAVCFTAFSSQSDSVHLYVDADDTADSVYVKLDETASFFPMLAMKTLGAVDGYAEAVKPGHYLVDSALTTLRLYRNLKFGRQTPIRLVIPPVRSMGYLSAKLGKALCSDSSAFTVAFTDSLLYSKLGVNEATLPCLFIPNTYEVYWTITPKELLDRMKKESDVFWNKERREKAEKVGLSREAVITLASIVEQETANNAEKPMIAGMYINRLRIGMKLQADPTIKFVLNDFSLRRILHGHLAVESPYNTYQNKGLPPGPIGIPSVASIDAVLNYAEHSYLYMCAREDFSGRHNFATTYAEHLKNARRYTQALNRRGITK